MERRFAVRYDELMAEAEVKPEALEGVLKRLGDFVKPFAANPKHDAQRQPAILLLEETQTLAAVEETTQNLTDTVRLNRLA